MRRFIAIWLILLTLSWYPVQAALTYSSSGHYLSTTQLPVTAAPFTVCAWVYPANLTNAMVIFSIITTAADTEYFALRLVGTVANDPFQWVSRTTAAGLVGALGATATAVNTWYHVCGVEASGSSRQVYLNGTQDGTNGTSRVPASLDLAKIARRGTASGEADRWDGTLGDVVVYNVALTAGEIAALAGGANPFEVRPTDLVSWVPAWDTTSAPIDLAAPRAWTLNGTPANATFGPPAGLFMRR